MHKAFHRPTTLLNRCVDWIKKRSPLKHAMDMDDIATWQDGSYRAFFYTGAARDILDRIVPETDWHISDETPPADVWFGEAKFDFNNKTRPQVIVYRNTAATRLTLTQKQFEEACQACMDHIFGHLYAYYGDQQDYGEEVACAAQYKVAKARRGFYWRIISGAMPLFYKLHKQIPLSNF